VGDRSAFPHVAYRFGDMTVDQAAVREALILFRTPASAR